MRPLISLLVAAVIALAGFPANVHASDPADDIPGIPLSGPIVTGQLGGPIIDRVYQVQVPSERVLILSLTGTTGTDFDLYLFDSTATSVYSTTGLVAKSTGPTSTESLTYSTVAGGLYYIDLSGFSEVEGNYRLTVAIGNDTNPPRASVSLDGGAPATNDRDAAVSVVATDDLSGVADMQFSADGATWDEWQPYVPTSDQTLSDSDGRKDLWARVRDGQGNISVAAHASIVLDRTPPTLVARTPAPGGAVPARRALFSVRFSEPIRLASWLSFGLILQDPAGTVVFGTYGWDPATNTGTFTPASDLQVGSVYVVSLGTITDLAGNALAPAGSWTVLPLQAPSVGLKASAAIAARGSTVTLSGSVDAWSGGAFTLDRLAPDGTWVPIVPLLPDADGSFFARVAMDSNASFRVAYSGSPASAATVSPTVRVLVRRSLTLSGPGPSIVRSALVGRTVSLTALVGPALPPTTVTMTLSRYDSASRAYRLVVRLSRTSSSGRAGFTWRSFRPGRYLVRLTTPPAATFASGVSGSYRWLVS